MGLVLIEFVKLGQFRGDSLQQLDGNFLLFGGNDQVPRRFKLPLQLERQRGDIFQDVDQVVFKPPGPLEASQRCGELLIPLCAIQQQATLQQHASVSKQGHRFDVIVLLLGQRFIGLQDRRRIFEQLSLHAVRFWQAKGAQQGHKQGDGHLRAAGSQPVAVVRYCQWSSILSPGPMLLCCQAVLYHSTTGLFLRVVLGLTWALQLG